MRRFLVAAAVALTVFGMALGVMIPAPQAQVIPFAFWKNESGGFGNAVRFRNAGTSSPHFAQTRIGGTSPADTHSYRKTYSFWVKRNRLGVYQHLFTNSYSNAHRWQINFDADDRIVLFAIEAGSTILNKITTSRYRDVSSWYHIVVATDTTASAAEDRVRLYVNGERVTSFGTNTNPSQNNRYAAFFISPSGGTWYPRIGTEWVNAAGGSYNSFDGYMANVHIIDGQTLTPASFAARNGDGQWVPSVYGGAYGTNGSYMNFADASAATDTALGRDSSGNNNNWSPTFFSVAAGAGGDFSLDGPAAGGNYPTWNALAGSPNVTTDLGNLRLSNCTGGNFCKSIATQGVSAGKWYWEVEVTDRGGNNSLQLGVTSVHPLRDTSNQNGVENGSVQVIPFDNSSAVSILANGSIVTSGLAATTNGQIIGIAFDADAAQVYFYRNGVALGNAGGYAIANVSGTFWPTAYTRISGTGSVVNANFGQRAFSYAPPSGYVALRSGAVAAPVIARPEAYFKAVTYTGNGVYNSIGEPARQSASVSIANSLRFRAGNPAYLSRTTTSTVTDRKKWTMALWFKRGALNRGTLLNVGGTTGTYAMLQVGTMGTAHTLDYHEWTTAYTVRRESNAVALDPAAWHHLVIAVDTTQAVGANRARMYLNGKEVTSFLGTADPALNYDTLMNQSSVAINIGRATNNSQAYDGYLADIHFVDGQQLDASAFGAFDGGGVWVPKAYAGGYGANGYRLDFADTSSAAATTLGKDRAGSNNWTPNNFSVAAGPANDALTDTPSAYDETHGNFSVLNPLDKNAAITLSEGNLTAAFGAATAVRGTQYVSQGKWYWEVRYNSVAGNTAIHGVGTAQAPLNQYPGASSNQAWAFYAYGGSPFTINGGVTGPVSGTAAVAGDIGMVALDMDAGRIWWGLNGTWFGSGNPVTGANPAFSNLAGQRVAPIVGSGTPASGSVSYNFGQRPFAHTPPTGFRALNSYNFANAGFAPDLVVVKNRTSAADWAWYDRERGASLELSSNLIAAQSAQTGGVLSFQNGGFTVGPSAKVNTAGNNYVAYMFKKGATPGFDIVTYTGNASGSGRTIAHNLGVTPSMIIIKGLNGNTGGSNWIVQHQSLATPPAANASTFTLQSYTNGIMLLNMMNAQQNYGYDAQVNGVGGEYVAYLFADVPGFSKFGSYTGNGSSDGQFVHTGFKPAFVLVKRVDAGYSWFILDNARNPHNMLNQILRPNEAAEDLVDTITADFTANGFKWRSVQTSENAAGAKYIYAAFAENPFIYSNAR